MREKNMVERMYKMTDDRRNMEELREEIVTKKILKQK